MSLIIDLIFICPPSLKPLIDSIIISLMLIDFSFPRSSETILIGRLILSQLFAPILAQTSNSPLINVVSLFSIGVLTVKCVLVEFQQFWTIFPPPDRTGPVIKSEGGFLSKIILLPLVDDVTTFPLLPEESEKLISKFTIPSLSELLKT